MSMNLVVLQGNLTRDPELRFTPGGTAVCDFGLAVNRKFKQNDEWKEEVTFVDITVWSKQAEVVTKHLSKGSHVTVEGRLRLEQWSDKDSGSPRSKLSVVANAVHFSPRGGSAESKPTTSAVPAGADAPADEEVPF